MTSADDEWTEVTIPVHYWTARTDPEPVTFLPDHLQPAAVAFDIEASLSRAQEAFARFAETLETLPMFQVPRGGIRFGEWAPVPHSPGWAAPGWPDPRQGEEVYVYDLLPGARVYVLEDVFTVDRVDMDATLPTVWLKELPTSPLYFTEDESIYLANESDD